MSCFLESLELLKNLCRTVGCVDRGLEGFPNLGRLAHCFLVAKDEGIGRFWTTFFFWSLLSYKEVGELHFDEHMCRKMAKQIVKKFCVMNGLIKFEAFNLTSIFRDLLKCCFC